MRSGSDEHLAHVALDPLRRCTAPTAGPRRARATRSTTDRRRAAAPARAPAAQRGSGSSAPVLRELHAFGRSSVPTSMSRNGVGTLLVDDPHHLLGSHAVGRQRGDERAGAGADVDVELVDGPVDGQQVERAQRADLVDPAGEPAAAEHERCLGALRRGAAPRVAPRRLSAAVSSLTTLPIGADCRDARLEASWPGTEAFAAVIGQMNSNTPVRALPRRAVSRATRRVALGAATASAFRRVHSEAQLQRLARSAQWRRQRRYVVDLSTGTHAVLRSAATRRGSRRRSRSSTRRRRRCGCFGPDARVVTRGDRATARSSAGGWRRPLPGRQRRSDARRAADPAPGTQPFAARRDHARRGPVRGDDSRFDALRGGPRTGGAYDTRHRRCAGRADGRPRLLEREGGPRARRGRVAARARCGAEGRTCERPHEAPAPRRRRRPDAGARRARRRWRR